MTARRVFPLTNFSHFTTGKIFLLLFFRRACPRSLLPSPSSGPPSSGFARVAPLSATLCFSLCRARGFSAFCFPTAASHPAKPSNLSSCDSSAWRDQSPPWVSSGADLLLRTRGRVPFYPINMGNFPDPFPHFFPPFPGIVFCFRLSPSPPAQL